MKKQTAKNKEIKIQNALHFDVGARLCPCPSRQNTQKGITLIALIITIIILLILAVVSIRLVMNNGILGKAESGVSKYQEAEADEQAQLLQAEYQMAKYEGSYTGTYTDYVLEKKYGVKTGDYVAYNEAGTGDYTTDTSKGIGGSVGNRDSTTGKYSLIAKTYTTEDLGWRVLGVNEKGELELISDNPTTDTLYLANEEGYLYGADELNTMCNILYGNGTGSTGKVVATGARSLNVDDINKLGNYDSTTYSEYGNIYIYRFPENGDYMQYKTIKEDETIITDWTNITDSNYQIFRLPGETDAISSNNKNNEGIKLKYTHYYYSVANNIVNSTISDMITKGTGTTNIKQWLASRAISCNSNYAGFRVRYVSSGDVGSYNLYSSYGGTYYNISVRPVVTLSSDIQLSGSSESGWTIN